MSNNLKPTCPFKMGNLCNDRCALYLEEEDSGEPMCAVTLLALSAQEISDTILMEELEDA